MAKILVTQSALDRPRYFGGEAGRLLEACGEVFWNDLDRALTSEEVAERIAGCAAITTGWGGCALPPQVYERADALKLVGVLGGGVKAYSPDLAFERGITICHTPRAIGRYVAEFALGLILSLCYGIAWHDELVRGQGLLKLPQGGYDRPDGWVAQGLTGSVVGIIGSGAVATHLIEMLRPYRCQVLVHDPYLSDERARELGVEKIELSDLLQRCEVLSVHAGWTPETEGMLGREQLALLRDGAIMVNTARMPLFDEQALHEEVASGRLKAALNLIPANPVWLAGDLKDRPNLLLSTGYATVADKTLVDMGRMLADDFRLFFAGQEPRHKVTPEMLPRMT